MAATPPSSPTASVAGRLGLPAPLADLARRRWDVLVVGAGHNGLACAAYLARAGRRVLVLEASGRVGGACSVEETWPGYQVPRCAAILGLLHPQVIADLGLTARGLRVQPAEGGMFVPWADGESLLLPEDLAICRREVARLAPADLAGWEAMMELVARASEAIRPIGSRDLWLDPEASHARLQDRLADDTEAENLVLRWSLAQLLDRYLTSDRLRQAYYGQGIIAADAAPDDPGTAALYLHHFSGHLAGHRGSWGYVDGGIGMVSFLLADAAREAGAAIACGAPVAAITPGLESGVGVELASGERLVAPVVVANADPVTTCRLLGGAVDPQWKARVAALPTHSFVAKVNLGLRELPNYRSRPGGGLHLRAVLDTPLSLREHRDGLAAARAGELPPRLFLELYLPTVMDPGLAPAGRHLASGFVQYVPHTFRVGSWTSRREEVERLVIAELARVTTNLPAAIEAIGVQGPGDIATGTGIAGGHPFHFDCLPHLLWDHRLPYRTPMPGVYLCGAGTHPGGGVTGVNGRNAALAVLADRTGVC
jgi:phytoene dehydrogenase-like protein